MGWIANIIYLEKSSGASFLDDEHRRVDIVPANVPGAPDAGMRRHMTDTVAFSVDNSRDSDNQVGHAGVFDGTVLLYIWLPLAEAR